MEISCEKIVFHFTLKPVLVNILNLFFREVADKKQHFTVKID